MGGGAVTMQMTTQRPFKIWCVHELQLHGYGYVVSTSFAGYMLIFCACDCIVLELEGMRY